MRKLREVERIAVVRGHKREAILQHGHHAESEQIDFDDLHVGAIFLVPLNYGAAGHGGRFDRHHGIELAAADHHASRVLPEMARQILHALAKLHVLGNAAVLNVEARVMKVAAERIVFILPLPGADKFGQAVQGLGIKAQSLACFACRRASAIGDDVGGHGRAKFAVTLIDVLNRTFALFAAGQVKIDIRPLATLLGEKALEEQIHSDRIDGGDAERVADHAVGRRAAPLHQNALASAELHDVPDDEEVAGEAELGDERQLALLPASARGPGVCHRALADSGCECLPRFAFQGTTASARCAHCHLLARGSRESDNRDRSSGR